MSGHSKWHSIKHKKGAADAKRGKVFTKHARLITIAAKNGADPEINPSLRAAIDAAKADNVPNDNIDRAVKKGAGDGSDDVQLFEITYEGYGPAGIALLIQSVTDNKNRSVSNIRTIMTKNGGNLGEAGSVAWMFEKKGYFLVDLGGKDSDEAELEIIELGADDIVKSDESMLEVYSAPDMFFEVKTGLEKLGFKIIESKLNMIPKNIVEITDKSVIEKVLGLIEKLEDDDDVMDVIANFDIPQEILDTM
jgi:YebC/PmpR family DNA-binding regulatory protein